MTNPAAQSAPAALSAAAEATSDEADATSARRAWMAVLAKAQPARLKQLAQTYLDGLEPEAAPRFTMLRKPETGLVMVRARAGGAGAPFNMGEMTTTRCTVLLDNAEADAQIAGVAYIAGRDGAHATLAAKLDALLQTPAHHDAVQAQILAPLIAERTQAHAKRRAQIGATKVDFFTMVRGED